MDLTESEPLLYSFLAELLELSSFIITELQNSDLLNVSAIYFAVMAPIIYNHCTSLLPPLHTYIIMG